MMRHLYKLGLLLLLIISFSLPSRAMKEMEANPFDHPQKIELQPIEEDIRAVLESEVGSDFEAKLTQHPFPLEVVADREVKYKIEDLNVNPQKTRFSASLVFEDYDVKPIRLAGSLTIMTKVPALTRVINPREKIEESDLEWITVPARRITKSSITEETQLIGAEPRNTPLKPGVLLRMTDLKRSRPVQKGQIVQVTLNHPKMSLDLKAKAMEDGDVGQIIKLNNLDSNKTLHAKVFEVGHAIIEINEIQ